MSKPFSRSSQILPGPTIALGPFLRPSAAPYGQTPVPKPILQSSGNVHLSLFVGDTLMLRHGLYFFWIYLQIRGLHFFQASLNFGSPWFLLMPDLNFCCDLFIAGLYSFCGGFYLYLKGMHLGYNFLVASFRKDFHFSQEAGNHLFYFHSVAM
jgi:hypothetical protein